jgi:hypothetical protein
MYYQSHIRSRCMQQGCRRPTCSVQDELEVGIHGRHVGRNHSLHTQQQALEADIGMT